MKTHKVKSLNSDSVRIRPPQLELVGCGLILVQLHKLGFGLEYLVANVGQLNLEIEVPELHSQIKPEIEGVMDQFEFKN